MPAKLIGFNQLHCSRELDSSTKDAGQVAETSILQCIVSEMLVFSGNSDMTPDILEDAGQVAEPGFQHIDSEMLVPLGEQPRRFLHA